MVCSVEEVSRRETSLKVNWMHIRRHSGEANWKRPPLPLSVEALLKARVTSRI
jgi:hypothetical protein